MLSSEPTWTQYSPRRKSWYHCLWSWQLQLQCMPMLTLFLHNHPCLPLPLHCPQLGFSRPLIQRRNWIRYRKTALGAVLNIANLWNTMKLHTWRVYLSGWKCAYTSTGGLWIWSDLSLSLSFSTYRDERCTSWAHACIKTHQEKKKKKFSYTS